MRDDADLTTVEVTRPERPDQGILIEGGAVVTVDGASSGEPSTVHDPGWVLVEGDRIAAVGAGAEAPAEIGRAAGHRIDARGQAVMPGMVNAHTHLFQTFFRGLADDKALLDWLRDCIWPGSVLLDGESARLAALVGLVENLRTGATSVIDHQYIHPDGPHAEAIDEGVCSAADDVGVRFLLARGWSDRNYAPRLIETVEQVLDRSEEVRARWHGHDGDRIRIELAPVIPWGCSDDAVQATVAASRAWGGGTHIHCAETKAEVDMSLDERGIRHVPWLDQLGVLGPDTQLAHSVWLEDDELDIVAERGAVVVHCPVSNMYLASGVPPVPAMRARGIPVALASDGPGSNNRQDLFEAMKAAALLAKVSTLDPVVLQPEDVLWMACRDGAKALGQPDRVGAIEVGRAADLVVVDLEAVSVGPVHRVPSALVYCASPAQVTNVVVDGRLVIDDGRVTMVDEARLMAAAAAAARRLFAQLDVTSRLRSSPPSPTGG